MTYIDPGEILIPLHEIAKAAGLRGERLVETFGRQNWAFQIGGSGQWLVYESTIAQKLPQLHQRWREMRDAGAFRMPGRARKGNRNAHLAKVARQAKGSKSYPSI
jgi:hypothetical protein